MIDIAVCHHHDHRLSLALRDQVIHDLCGTSQSNPSLLVTTHTMKQVEYGILFPTRLIACWGVDGYSTAHAQCRAVVPAASHCAMRHLVYTVIVALATLRDENVGYGCYVTIQINIVRVGGFQTVHDK